MTPPVTAVASPTLFPIEVHDNRGRSLEDVMLEVLADADHGPCPVCDGALAAIIGGVRCGDCGAEILQGEEPAPTWVD